MKKKRKAGTSTEVKKQQIRFAEARLNGIKETKERKVNVETPEVISVTSTQAAKGGGAVERNVPTPLARPNQDNKGEKQEADWKAQRGTTCGAEPERAGGQKGEKG